MSAGSIGAPQLVPLLLQAVLEMIGAVGVMKLEAIGVGSELDNVVPPRINST